MTIMRVTGVANLVTRAAQYAPGLLLGTVFLLAAIHKARDPREAQDALATAFGLAPVQSLQVLHGVVLTELAPGVVLVFRLWARGALFVSALLLLAFPAFTIRLWATGASVGCGCGAFLRAPPGPGEYAGAVARNATLMAIAITGLGFARASERARAPRGGARIGGLVR